MIEEADIQDITFKMVFSVPDGFNCFTDRSTESLVKKISKRFDLNDSGIGFGTFGVEIGIDSYQKIEKTKIAINKMALATLRIEPLRVPPPPRQETVYSVVFDISHTKMFGLDKIQLKQVIYSDNRLFQTIIIEKKYLDDRAVMNKVKNNIDLYANFSNMVSYGFVSGYLAFTLNQERKLSNYELIDFVTKIMK